MNPSQNGVGVALSAYCTLYNNGSLVLMTNAMPATPETALSGNTPLCTGIYAATAYGAPAFSAPNMVSAASFTAGAYSPVAGGTATFARGYKADGTTAEGDFTVGSAWIPSQAAALAQYCLSGGNTYRCTTAGLSSTVTPSGTTTFTDGAAVWTYVGVGQLFDVLIGNPIIQIGVPVAISQTMKMPAV